MAQTYRRSTTKGLGHTVVTPVCEIQDLDLLTIAFLTSLNGKCILRPTTNASENPLVAMGDKFGHADDVSHVGKVGSSFQYNLRQIDPEIYCSFSQSSYGLTVNAVGR